MRLAGYKPSALLVPFPSGWRGFFLNMNADTPDSIRAFQLLALKGALKLESLGMHRSHGPSALAMVKMLGIKARTAKAALPLFEAKLKAEGILR